MGWWHACVEFPDWTAAAIALVIIAGLAGGAIGLWRWRQRVERAREQWRRRRRGW